MRKKPVIGIYGIWDTPLSNEVIGLSAYASGKYAYSPIYVGQSIDIDARWQQHKKMLEKGCHHNHELQQMANEVGVHNFEFGLLEMVANKHDLNSREEYWINQYGWAHLCNSSNEKKKEVADDERSWKMSAIMDKAGLMPAEFISIAGKTMCLRRFESDVSFSIDHNLDAFAEMKREGFSGGIVEIKGRYYFKSN